jgi:hypothetical protein
MGILDGILGKKEEPVHPGLPFAVLTSLRPVRLAARRENCLEVLTTIKNVTETPVMTSATLEIPRALGFDNISIAKIKEIRIGELAPHTEKTVSFQICANSQTLAATYLVMLTVNQHYRDYAHVQNYVKKKVEVRAV